MLTFMILPNALAIAVTAVSLLAVVVATGYAVTHR